VRVVEVVVDDDDVGEVTGTLLLEVDTLARNISGFVTLADGGRVAELYTIPDFGAGDSGFEVRLDEY